MKSNDDVLSFMDLLDLDEELIDKRLKTIMAKENYTERNLVNYIQLLQYKQLINDQEGTECDNEDEFQFVITLIKEIHLGNIENVCKIMSIVLGLHVSSLMNKSQHLLQQILENVETPSDCSTEEDNSLRDLLNLRICDTILETAIKKSLKLHLPFLEVPIENFLHNPNEKVRLHFLTYTVPKFFESVVGYNILNNIWQYIEFTGDQKLSVKILTCLSDFYLPIIDTNVQSNVVFNKTFWNIMLAALQSDDVSLRKNGIYLTKRAIDNVKQNKRDILLKSEDNIVFFWEVKRENELKMMWDNYFILLDSLEEKQSNIVLPSLSLFEALDNIGNVWLNCAFEIGFKHDNTEVRLKCIKQRLKIKVNNKKEALALLQALNDINLYEGTENLETEMYTAFNSIETFIHIFETIPLVKWSPVPFYYTTRVLTCLEFRSLSNIMTISEITNIICNILNVQCNNSIIQIAVQNQLLIFVGNCSGFGWKECAELCSHFKFDINIFNVKLDHPIIKLVEKIVISNDEKYIFFKSLSNFHKNVDFLLFYLNFHTEDINIFIDMLTEKINHIDSITHSKYTDKRQCLEDVIFMAHLFKNTMTNIKNAPIIHEFVEDHLQSLLQYFLALLHNDVELSIDEMKVFFKEIDDMYQVIYEPQHRKLLIEIINLSVTVLRGKDNNLRQKVYSCYAYSIFAKKAVLHNDNVQLDVNQLIELFTTLEYPDNVNESNSRLKNILYEKFCKIINISPFPNIGKLNIENIVTFVDNVTECGGYGCLKWILKIVNRLLEQLLDYDLFNVPKFLNRMWREIEEIKSNSEYSPCIEEFVKLITGNEMMKNHEDTVLFYCNKIIEYGILKNTPLFYLINEISKKDISNFGYNMAEILSKILLFSPVPRKDQRITDDVIRNISSNEICDNIEKHFWKIHTNFRIQCLSCFTLGRISSIETLENIMTFMQRTIDNLFKNKQRYHGNSTHHRVCLSALQSMLMILLKSREINIDSSAKWCMKFLGKLPHQPSVRVSLEWFIALSLYLKKSILNKEVLEVLKSYNVQLTSQFTIFYWTLKHKINTATFTNEDYEFVIEMLLSNTMGAMFNIRLHSQYFAAKLYEIDNQSKYEYTIGIIKTTFSECKDDKNFVKLKNDYFSNDFDIVSNLTPAFVLYYLPKYCDIGSDIILVNGHVKALLRDISKYMQDIREDEFLKEWNQKRIPDKDVFEMNLCTENERKVKEGHQTIGTIQKKYIPWINMNFNDKLDSNEKRKSGSELIVVASLVDKLPNLGGMARTSEVFGVHTYVVDSLRHLQDQQFQGLSVSAERWVNIEEVRPGTALKEYLMMKKGEGYTIIAAEQTSTSCALQDFRFPKKTLLLLGHEKEGVPCNLLPIMDHCVEIPQQGYVRSLNVHVTAAIFVWEYTRQNVL